MLRLFGFYLTRKFLHPVGIFSPVIFRGQKEIVEGLAGPVLRKSRRPSTVYDLLSAPPSLPLIWETPTITFHLFGEDDTESQSNDIFALQWVGTVVQFRQKLVETPVIFFLQCIERTRGHHPPNTL